MKIAFLHFACYFTLIAKTQSDWDTLPVIDYHVHIFSHEMLRNLHSRGYDLEKHGFEVLLQDSTAYGNADTLLHRNKADKMLLISSGYAYRDLVHGDEQAEYDVVKRENDFLKSLVDLHQDKFIGFAGMHPLKAFADEEIIRCSEVLDLHGIKLHFQSSEIDLRLETHLRRIIEIFQLCSELDLPVLIHNNAWPWNPADDYARIFFDSILTQVDSLTIIFAHGGGGGLYDHIAHTFLTTYLSRRDTPEMRKHKLYFELSGIAHDTPFPRRRPLSELHELILEIGTDRLVFGSDYPFRTVAGYAPIIRANLRLDEDVLKEILTRDLFEEITNR